ncbi:Protein-export membrane protein [Vibrio crassostreae]|nr:Protein-export membrane protein [Vibrio crassostreae]
MVARRAHNPKVVGSNPAPATNLLVEIQACDTSSAGRAQPCQG